MTPYIEQLNLKPQTITVMQIGLGILLVNHSSRGYHNPSHGIETAENSLRIAVAMDAGDEIMNIEGIAGMYHDAVQNLSRGKNEISSGKNEFASAHLARTAMIETGGFTRNQIFAVCEKMIPATTVDISPDGRISHPKLGDDLASEILIDGDMANLGKEPPVHWSCTRGLFQERFPDDPMDGMAMHKFLGESVVLLSTYQFHTPVAKKLFPHQEENLDFIKQKYEELGEKLGLAA